MGRRGADGAGVFRVWGRAVRGVHWQAQCPLAHAFLPAGWGSLLSFPLALPQGIKSCPPPYPAFPPRRFPKAQERVQHPDLNFNAILAPTASFCCCFESKLIRKVLSAPALQDPHSALGRSSPCPAALPPAFQRGGSLCFDICYYYFFFLQVERL